MRTGLTLEVSINAIAEAVFARPEPRRDSHRRARVRLDIDVSEVAMIWRDGCIIRAELLERLQSEYANHDLPTSLEAPSVSKEVANGQDTWRSQTSRAVLDLPGGPRRGSGVRHASALGYYDLIRAPRVNSALTLGPRDYFGAHLGFH